MATLNWWGNVYLAEDANTTVSSTTFESTATDGFSNNLIGLNIYIPGAGPSGGPLNTTVSAVIDTNHLTLAVAASTAVTGGTGTFWTLSANCTIGGDLSTTLTVTPAGATNTGDLLHLIADNFNNTSQFFTVTDTQSNAWTSDNAGVVDTGFNGYYQSWATKGTGAVASGAGSNIITLSFSASPGGYIELVIEDWSPSSAGNTWTVDVPTVATFTSGSTTNTSATYSTTHAHAVASVLCVPAGTIVGAPVSPWSGVPSPNQDHDSSSQYDTPDGGAFLYQSYSTIQTNTTASFVQNNTSGGITAVVVYGEIPHVSDIIPMTGGGRRLIDHVYLRL